MKKKSPVVLIFASVLLTLFGSEIVLHFISHTDSEGNIYVAGRRIRPFQFPIKNLEEKLVNFTNQKTSYTHYDPDLGWAVRLTSQSENGLYFSNSARIRTPSSRQETPLTALPKTLRIAIFEDSFTPGDDVPSEEN